MNISVLIITLNEENNLERCLKSLSWCDDITVLDSFSTDKTEQIAKAAGVNFFQRPFDNYSKQRNFGLNQIAHRYSWLFMVDADEIVSDNLAHEIANLPENADDICIYRMRRKDHFMGKWIKHSSGYPTWFGRLLRIGRTRVERSINEEYQTDGSVSYLKHHLIHYPFNKGFYNWIEKHNSYSSMEAKKKISEAIDIRTVSVEKFFFDPVERRRLIKKVVYRLPLRPLLIFSALFFFRLGFMDGRAGLHFCILRAFYEFMIDCKVEEIKLRQQNFSL